MSGPPTVYAHAGRPPLGGSIGSATTASVSGGSGNLYQASPAAVLVQYSSGNDIVGIGACLAGSVAIADSLVVELHPDDGTLTYPSATVLASATIPLNAPTNRLSHVRATFGQVPLSGDLVSDSLSATRKMLVGLFASPISGMLDTMLWIVAYPLSGTPFGINAPTIEANNPSGAPGSHDVGLQGASFGTMVANYNAIHFRLIHSISPVVWVYNHSSGSLAGLASSTSIPVTIDSFITSSWGGSAPWAGVYAGGVTSATANGGNAMDLRGTSSGHGTGDYGNLNVTGVNGWHAVPATAGIDTNSSFFVQNFSTSSNSWTDMNFFLTELPTSLPWPPPAAPTTHARGWAAVIG
jgi:hypothetical protein